MNSSKQRTWRLVIPGIMLMCLALCMPRTQALQASFKDVSSLVAPVISVVLGALYSIIGIGRWARVPYRRKIDTHIVDRLIKIGEPDPSQASKLRDDPQPLMHAYFRILQCDATLKHLYERALLQGLIWSSCVDFTVISGFASVVLFLVLLLNRTQALLFYTWLFSATYIVGYLLSNLTTKQYIDTADSQISEINLRHRDMLISEIQTIVG